MPFGERLGSISPRASYIRSVCGCISASSAATEIMNTPRSWSTRAVIRVVRGARHQATAPAASRRIRSRGLPFITFESCLDGVALLVGEVASGTSITKR